MKINDRGQGRSFWVIVTAIIALVVLVLVILWFRSSGGDVFKEMEGKISSLGDCDGDNVANMFDKCPCDKVVGEENPEASGCPKNTESRECGKNGAPTVASICPKETE